MNHFNAIMYIVALTHFSIVALLFIMKQEAYATNFKKLADLEDFQVDRHHAGKNKYLCYANRR